LLFLLFLPGLGCHRSLSNLNPADPADARVVKLLWLHQHGDSHCISVGRAAILFGGVSPDYAGGTFTTGPRVVYEEVNTHFAPLSSQMLLDGAAHDQGTAWLELAEGTRAGLDETSRIVVDAAMEGMPGLTLRDAGDRSNWTAIHTETIRALEPSPGHPASECAALAASGT
jgi:hypothetical protein